MWHSGRKPAWYTDSFLRTVKKENRRSSDVSRIIEFLLILECD